MLQLAFIAFHVLAMQVVGADYVRMCYFSNWAQFRVGDANFEVEDIDPTLCSHILYGFAGVENNQLKTTQWNDDQMYKKVIGLKVKNPDLKVLLSIGGAGTGLTVMSQMLATQTTRGIFIISCVSVLQKYGFDGIDLDFEFPGLPPSIPEDKQRFGLLLQEIKEAFLADQSTKSYQLSVAVATFKPYVDAGYDVAKLGMYADYILIITYDYHGPWDSKTGHNSPLYERNPGGPFGSLLNMNWGTFNWIQLGIPKEKIIIGMPLFGHGFVLADRKETGLGVNVTKPSPGQAHTNTSGYLAYYEVCWHLLNPGKKPTIVRSPEQQVPYFYKDLLWVGYDDTESLRNKVRWLKTLGLGGFFVWDLTIDDFKGAFCKQGPFPLLKALREEILADPGEPPLPPPRYLLDEICAPCVGKDMEFDCNPNDTSLYHRCSNERVQNSPRCASDTPVFIVAIEKCVSQDQLSKLEQCENNCGRSPEAEYLKALGIPRNRKPVTVPAASVMTSPSPTEGNGGRDVITVRRYSNGIKVTPCHREIMLIWFSVVVYIQLRLQ